MRFRTIYGTLMILGVGILVYLDYRLFPSRPMGSLFMAAMVVLGWFEFSRITGISGKEARARRGFFSLGLAAILYFIAIAWLSAQVELPRGENIWLLGGLAGAVLGATTLAVTGEDFKNSYLALAQTVLGVVLLGFLLSYVLRIYRLPDWRGPVLWAILVGGVKGTDSAAYYVGKAWGRHRIYKVSPNKTLEGSVGGIVFGVLYFAIAGGLVHRFGDESLFSWTGGMLLGVMISIASQVGDLGESLVKRVYGVKDSSTMLPEFGGALDMMDSLVFTGFIFWIFL